MGWWSGDEGKKAKEGGGGAVDLRSAILYVGV